MRTYSLLALLVALLAACKPAAEAAPTAEPPPVGVVDSILPIEELLRRFRVGLTEPAVLGGGAAPTRDSLVASLFGVLARRDTAALATLVIDRAEFAWLYYPQHMYAKPPYELGPDNFWQLIQGNSGKGAARLLDRVAGGTAQYQGMTCEPSTSVTLPLKEWQNCKVRLILGGAPQELVLFGSIAERDGKFKFVSYSNDF